jgi:hypothetical protein
MLNDEIKKKSQLEKKKTRVNQVNSLNLVKSKFKKIYESES